MKTLTPEEWEREYVEALKCLYVLSEVAGKMRDAILKLRHDYQEDGFPSKTTILNAEAAICLLNKGSLSCQMMTKLLDRAEQIASDFGYIKPSSKQPSGMN